MPKCTKKTKSGQSRTVSKEPSTPPPGLIIRLRNSDPMLVDARLVRVDELATIKNQLEMSDDGVSIELLDVHVWPDVQRWELLTFLHSLSVPFIIRVDEQEFSDMFEAILASLKGPSNVAWHSAGIKAAVEAAALCFGDSPETCAGRIARRITELGAQKISVSKLIKRILQLTGPTAEQTAREDSDPMLAADRYLTNLSIVLGQDGIERPLLLYLSQQFFEFDGIIWSRVEDALIRMKVVRFLQTKGGKAPTGEFVSNVVLNLQSRVGLDDWEQQLPFWLGCWPEQTRSNDCWIVFRNGMLGFDAAISNPDAELVQHDSRWVSEIVLPFDYDAQAQCPRWDAFLNQVLPRTSPEDHRQEILDEFMGYLLLQDCRFERALILFGNGANGKSVVLNVMGAMLGEKNVAAIPLEQLCGEFRLIGLLGKAANISREIGHIGKTNEGALKQLISGEPVDANIKFKAPRKVKLSAKLIVATNHLPTFNDTSNAIWRRLILIPFEVSISQANQDPNLSQQLISELPGIFTRALAGLRRVLNQCGFTVCVRCEAAKAVHRTDSDSVADFVSALCGRHAPGQVLIQPFYELYVFHCKMRGRKFVAINEFGKRLAQLQVMRVRGTENADGRRPWIYRGLRLNAEGHQWQQRLVAQEHPGWESVIYDST